MTTPFQHRPVLLEPTIDALAVPADGVGAGVWVDATFGRGGHSRALLARLGPGARLVVFDKDPQAIAEAGALAGQDGRVTVVHEGFGALAEELSRLGVTGISGLMMDLGISSPQIDDAQRGFSFMRNGPLDMRMDTTRGETAAQWLAHASIDDMREVIARYGEERFAFQIAKAIAASREKRPITTTGELADIVAGAVRTREKGQHPATRTFQAIRIHLNQELEELPRALAAALDLLVPGGRLAVISFHSLEDRIVKQFIAAAARPGAETARLPLRESERPQPVLKSVGRILPSEEEIAANPRARSAVLRVAERTHADLPAGGGKVFVKMPDAPGARRRPPARSRTPRAHSFACA
ncbi:MAG: 16S rRNA (cytosine(1402)-N(4))-methyltransferase RsmH [Pigmentiphaga sp.]|uniref:16S rRNA (cytosine(1402)-N(4))-methyltransferase RsmH n=1 Tax=Pigmentiphaga sp. TaxID=1977564 RepID=UPI0029B271CC|nr:16S rRNA (cytosine(1402)-N(4))-methyltransferase RsmH [Pigmentiphaga sp.]MDX3904978.1 16S rRNA (cytosine(1402)-N(4))-methyltransferase RsmH [Pigmentiphaga sp.]